MMDNVARHTLAKYLVICGETMEKLQCSADDLSVQSDEFLVIKRKYDAERSKRIGALELAYTLNIITETELHHSYGMSNLIEKLMEE